MKKAAPQYQQSSTSPEQHITAATAQTKIARVLAHLLTGASVNRFEAEHLGDHCLPSTVSRLQKRGLLIERQLEPVPNGWGEPCRAARYRLPASERDKARTVLALVNRRGRAKP